MSRRFSADDSEIRWAIVAANNFTGAHTLAIVVRRRNTGAWNALIGHHSSSGTGGLGLEFNNTNKLSYTPDNVVGSLSTSTSTSTTNWLIVVMTKTAGFTKPRFHWIDLTAGGAWTHQDGDTSVNNPSSKSGGTVRVGEYADVDDANMNVAVVAEWAVALTDAQVEELSANSRTSDFWSNSGGNPVLLGELNQAAATDAVPDLPGNGAAWVLTNGTTVDGATNPPEWVYDGTGGGGTSTVGAAIAQPATVRNLSGASTVQRGAVRTLIATSLTEPATVRALAGGSLGQSAAVRTFIAASLSQPTVIKVLAGGSLAEPAIIHALAGAPLTQSAAVRALVGADLVEQATIRRLAGVSLEHDALIRALVGVSLEQRANIALTLITVGASAEQDAQIRALAAASLAQTALLRALAAASLEQAAQVHALAGADLAQQAALTLAIAASLTQPGILRALAGSRLDQEALIRVFVAASLLQTARLGAFVVPPRAAAAVAPRSAAAVPPRALASVPPRTGGV